MGHPGVSRKFHNDSPWKTLESNKLSRSVSPPALAWDMKLLLLLIGGVCGSGWGGVAGNTSYSRSHRHDIQWLHRGWGEAESTAKRWGEAIDMHNLLIWYTFYWCLGIGTIQRQWSEVAFRFLNVHFDLSPAPLKMVVVTGRIYKHISKLCS